MDIENCLEADSYFYWIPGSDNEGQRLLTWGVRDVKKNKEDVDGGGGREVGSGA